MRYNSNCAESSYFVVPKWGLPELRLDHYHYNCHILRIFDRDQLSHNSAIHYNTHHNGHVVCNIHIYKHISCKAIVLFKEWVSIYPIGRSMPGSS